MPQATDEGMDPFRDILGLELPPEQYEAELAVFRTIAEEIRKLRSLDLTEVHPAVVYDPLLGHRTDEP